MVLNTNCDDFAILTAINKKNVCIFRYYDPKYFGKSGHIMLLQDEWTVLLHQSGQTWHTHTFSCNIPVINHIFCHEVILFCCFIICPKWLYCNTITSLGWYRYALSVLTAYVPNYTMVTTRWAEVKTGVAPLPALLNVVYKGHE